MRRVGSNRGEFKSYLALGLSLGEIKRNETLRSGKCARCKGRHPRELFEISTRKFYICRVRRSPRWKVVIGDDEGKNKRLSLRQFMAAFPLEAVSRFQQAGAKTSQSIAHLQTDLDECEQTADIKTIQHGLTQLQTRIATVNGVIENVNSANVTRTSFAPVDIRSTIKPELENILGLIEDVRGLLNSAQVNLMRQSNVIRFNEAAQELDAAAKNLVAGLRSKVMIRPGLGSDLPEFEDPPATAPSPQPILHPSETPPTRSRLHQAVLIAGVLALCLSTLVVWGALNDTGTKGNAPTQDGTQITKGNEQPPTEDGTQITKGNEQPPTEDGTQITKGNERAPAHDEAIQQSSPRVLATTSARAPRKTTLPLSAAHVRLIWSSNQAVTGKAYQTLGISSHEQCAKRCRNDTRCEAMDYAKESETCRLFGSIERSDPSANSDYALKAQ
jgi:hypothetical protein